MFAAEPQVADPVELVFDERGRAFVAEMADYPFDPQPGQLPRSRIRLIEDSDGDGRADRSTIFADRLLNATSLLPWKGGLIVTAAPDILYLKDSDGDDRADVREVLFTGFAVKVDSESRITNLRFNIDNWIYASNNGQPGTITFSRRPKSAPVSVLGSDFRFRLDRGQFEAASGPTQFGQAIDAWGHRFITQNTVHVRQVVMPWRYFVRNPFLSLGGAAQDISDHGQPSVPIFPVTEPQYWRRVRTEMRQQRYREHGLDEVRELNPSTEIVGGFFTAAAGSTIYLGDTFPERYRGNLFTGDVSANIVHRDTLEPAGVTFLASRGVAEQDREFLASSDPWFRPCNFLSGPDGNLYLVDMYREFVETPSSIPDELKQEMDFYSGDKLGRIYRIVPRQDQEQSRAEVELSSRPGPEFPDLSQTQSRRLVRMLLHPNGWWRFTAQRLLLERQEAAVVPMLRLMAAENDVPTARLHALYILEGMSSLDVTLVKAALADPDPAVRAHAVALAEGFSEMGLPVAGMADDPSDSVQFQVALSLGEFVESESQLGALARIAGRQVEDPWFRKAILSSTPESVPEFLEVLLLGGQFFEDESAAKALFLEELSAVVGARNRQPEIIRWLRTINAGNILNGEYWQLAALRGLGRGLELVSATRLEMPAVEAQLVRLLTGSSEQVQSAARAVAAHFRMSSLLSASMEQALDSGLSQAHRQQAIRLLGSGSLGRVRPVFETLLDSETDPELVKAAVETVATFGEPEVSELLLSKWGVLGPKARLHLLDVLSSYRERIPDLLEAVASGRVEGVLFDRARIEKLLGHPDAAISSRARQVFRLDQTDRSEVMDSYKTSLSLQADVERGRGVFEENCATCHLAKGGRRVGPSLAGVSAQSKTELLQAILDPSSAIEARYTNYVVTTRDGRLHDGLVVNEAPGTLTLRNSQAEDQTFLRSNIEEIRASSVSLMPEGLESDLGPQEVADLISFLQGLDLTADN